MSRGRESVLLSLKPRYADLVFKGLKKAELRRRIAPHFENREVFVYVSGPTRALRGGFRVGNVWRGTPEEVWREVSQLGQVDRGDFDAYYAGRSVAYALEITNVWEYEEPVRLSKLRTRYPDFVAPQSWRYVRPHEYRSFRAIKRREWLKPKRRSGLLAASVCEGRYRARTGNGGMNKREGKTIRRIRDAVGHGTLEMPFSPRDVNDALGISWGGTFLPKHRIGNPGGNTELFMKVSCRPALYRLASK